MFLIVKLIGLNCIIILFKYKFKKLKSGVKEVVII